MKKILNYLVIAILAVSTKGKENFINNDPFFWNPKKGDVYVAGSTASINGFAVVTVWKNGVAQNLFD